MTEYSHLVISHQALEDARNLGLEGDVEDKLRRMVENSTVFSHPRGNRRFSKVMLLVRDNILQSVAIIDIDPRAQDKRKARLERKRAAES